METRRLFWAMGCWVNVVTLLLLTGTVTVLDTGLTILVVVVVVAGIFSVC